MQAQPIAAASPTGCAAPASTSSSATRSPHAGSPMPTPELTSKTRSVAGLGLAGQVAGDQRDAVTPAGELAGRQIRGALPGVVGHRGGEEHLLAGGAEEVDRGRVD